MKKIIILLGTFILCMSFVNAFSVNIKLEISKDNEVNIIDKDYSNSGSGSYFDPLYTPEKVLKAKIKDLNEKILEEHEIKLVFYSAGDPGIITEYEKVYSTVSFNSTGNEKWIEIYDENNIRLLKEDIAPFCNKNNVCDNKEYYYACPNECDTWEKDGYCNPVRDGYCDEDCPQIDNDCKKDPTIENNINSGLKDIEENRVPTSFFNTTNISLILLSIALFGIVGYLIWFILRKE